MRRVHKVRMGRAEVAGELVQSLASDEDARRNIEYAIVSVQLVYRCTPAGSITLAEDFLQVPLKQLNDSLGHRHPFRDQLSGFLRYLTP